jgi:DNA invertase Pin-like site-specific DNA recombinase
MDEIGKRGIHFRSLMENIDTASSGGRLMFHLMAALAEFERSIISERTKAGLAVAKREGRQLGRPKILTSEQIAAANDMIARGASTVDDIAAGLRVSTRTLRRHIDCTKLSTGPKSRLGLKNGP